MDFFLFFLGKDGETTSSEPTDTFNSPFLLLSFTLGAELIEDRMMMPLCMCMSVDGPACLEHLDMVAFDLACISRDCILPASFKLLLLSLGDAQVMAGYQ